MGDLSIWVLAAWTVAVGVLWGHALWLYRKTQRDCRAVLDRLDRADASITRDVAEIRIYDGRGAEV